MYNVHLANCLFGDQKDKAGLIFYQGNVHINMNFKFRCYAVNVTLKI